MTNKKNIAPPQEEIAEILQHIHTVADSAAKVTLPAFRSGIRADNKGPNPAAGDHPASNSAFDPVTAADREAEQAMRSLINKLWPTHTIVGEEFGTAEGTSPWGWCLDPIDGTRAFISGLPSWGTLIAVTYMGTPVIGVIDQPFLKERYIGTPTGSTLNGQPIRTSNITHLADATLTSTDPFLFSESEQPHFSALRNACKLTRYGLDCYGYAVLASGHMDIAAESGLKPFDLMALLPIITGAGGVVTSWSGGPAHTSKGDIVAAATPALHQAALGILAGA